MGALRKKSSNCRFNLWSLGGSDRPPGPPRPRTLSRAVRQPFSVPGRQRPIDRSPPSRRVQVLGGRCKSVCGSCDEGRAEGLGWGSKGGRPSDGGSEGRRPSQAGVTAAEL